MTYIPAELRHKVIELASNCCEYCRLSQDDYPFAFHMEHIISEKHDGETVFENLALSCPTCNRFKGSDISGAGIDTGEAIFLFHPRKQKWDIHFQISGTKIEAKTPEGRLTVRLLQLNHPDQIKSRNLLIQTNRYPCNYDSK